MEHLKQIIMYLVIGITILGVFGGLFYSISIWQNQSNQNQQAMVKQAAQACNGHLLFFFKEYNTGHPIFACEQK